MATVAVKGSMREKLPTRAECRVICDRIDKWLKVHKPQTREEWAQQGAEYLAMQALQISTDFYKLQLALEGGAE